jgi:hypothetical protein
MIRPGAEVRPGCTGAVFVQPSSTPITSAPTAIATAHRMTMGDSNCVPRNRGLAYRTSAQVLRPM